MLNHSKKQSVLYLHLYNSPNWEQSLYVHMLANFWSQIKMMLYLLWTFFPRYKVQKLWAQRSHTVYDWIYQGVHLQFRSVAKTVVVLFVHEERPFHPCPECVWRVHLLHFYLKEVVQEQFFSAHTHVWISNVNKARFTTTNSEVICEVLFSSLTLNWL